MKKILLFLFLIQGMLYAQLDVDALVTRDKKELIQKMKTLSVGITEQDDVSTILRKLENFIDTYQLKEEYPDDKYALESARQALLSVKQGGYGIGAVLIDDKGEIIHAAYNAQLIKMRSDLHAEMNLLTEFENDPASEPYKNTYVYKKGLSVFSSAEPCPMCFIRLATVGTDTRYCVTGPDDGMTSRISCLPYGWQQLAKGIKMEKGASSPELQLLSHVLFYSYLLDDRGPQPE